MGTTEIGDEWDGGGGGGGGGEWDGGLVVCTRWDYFLVPYHYALVAITHEKIVI